MLIAIRLVFWAACAGVAVLSLLPAALLPPSLFDWWDKAQHALAFAALSTLGQYAYMSARRRVVFGLMAYGALIEIAQHATGWRYGDVLDWVADCVGIGIGFALMTLVHWPNAGTVGVGSGTSPDQKRM